MDLKKLLPSILSLVIMASSMAAAPVQDWVSTHPIVATLLAGLGTILANFSPQPHKS